MDSTLEKPLSSAQIQQHPVLIVEDSDGKRSIPLNSATYSVGRDPSNTIQINDRAASRHHFMLIRMPHPHQDGMYRLVDGDANGKASLNGILVNDDPCRKKDLENGDIIAVGKVTKIQYLAQTLPQEEGLWSVEHGAIATQAGADPSSDPVMTMTTILSC